MFSSLQSLSAMLRRLMILLAIAGFSGAALSGCNTVEGAGEDIESVGEEIDETAD